MRKVVVPAHAIRSPEPRRRPIVPTTSIVSRLRRPAAPLLLLSALFVAAGGVIHLREWLDIYRDVPASLPGADVVRLGFLINAAVSAGIAVALLGAVFLGRRASAAIVAGAALFEAASLATLVWSRRGSVFGWTETGWSRGATQTGRVEIGALVVLAALIVLREPSDDGNAVAPDTANDLASRVPAS
jgi:hypothetical protein